VKRSWIFNRKSEYWLNKKVVCSTFYFTCRQTNLALQTPLCQLIKNRHSIGKIYDGMGKFPDSLGMFSNAMEKFPNSIEMFLDAIGNFPD